MSEPTVSKARQLLVRAADRAGLVEESLRHPLNHGAELHAYELSRQVGLARTAVNLVRVPAHRESYAYHSHAAEEEWLFVLRGAGIVEIGEEGFDVVPGDFVGFPAGAPPHCVRNPYSEELSYLCGGEIVDVDVLDFPRAERRAVRVGREVTVYPTRAGERLFAKR